VVPQTVDQPYWGRRIYELGCGPKPVRLRKLTSEILAGALADLTTNETYRRNAAEVAEQLQGEDGIEKAMKVIERVMTSYVPRVPVIKKAKKIKTPLKLVG
ncbi:MAG: glycosyltransferase family 1 protein, partial [Devosia sp.]|nr:glycosyltransferase family 1 protein [Devosia sp.]